jgi:hypothetical protein
VASSLYNSLQVAWNRRFSQGLLFGVAYTLSKSSDNGSNQRDIIPDTYYAGNLWGPSEFDTRHVLLVNFLYDLPFFKNQHSLMGKTVGGWAVSGIFQVQSGNPCSIGVSNDYVGVGLDGSMCGIGQFWQLNGPINYTKAFAANGTNDPNQWIQVKNADGSSIVSQPAKGTFVTQQGVRDSVYNPGLNNWNLGLFKKFTVSEHLNFQFRAEAFDAMNHPNFGGIGFNPTAATFGKVTGKTGDVRNLQLSLKAQF